MSEPVVIEVRVGTPDNETTLIGWLTTTGPNVGIVVVTGSEGDASSVHDAIAREGATVIATDMARDVVATLRAYNEPEVG